MDDFEEIFEDLEDPRTGNAKRHELHEILVIGFCTLLSGGETCADMALFGRSKRAFLQQFLRLEQGIPSHDTFSRVFRLLDPGQFHAWFIGFMRQFAETCEGVVAIDGKTLRRSFDRAAAASPLHLVSAWAVDARLCLGQLAVGDKSNEIVAVPKLLELLSLKGRIVTADAMSCQRKIAQQVVDQGADYVLALKGNQETLHDDVRRFLDDPETPLVRATDTDKGHGRIETRTAALTTDIAWLQESHDWTGRALRPSARSPPAAKSTARRRSRHAATCSAKPSRQSASMPSCVATGASRTPCTGCSTSSWTRIRPETARATAPKTSPSCASLPSTSPSSNRQRAPCAESSNKQDGTIPTSPKS